MLFRRPVENMIINKIESGLRIFAKNFLFQNLKRTKFSVANCRLLQSTYKT